MADSTPKSYHTDPTLYLYTSLTAGSSHIITATSRLETILKANRISFQALDVATDEKARMLWGRRAKNKKLPGLVRMGMIVADLGQVEEWNEYGELKENLEPGGSQPVPTSTPTPSANTTPSKPPPSTSVLAKTPSTPLDTNAEASVPNSSKDPPASPAPGTADEAPLTTALRQAGFEAAKKASNAKTKARQDALAAAKAKDESLRKLDNSPPTGVPPPSDTTEAEDAKKPETAGAEVEGKAENVPVTRGEHTNADVSATQGDKEGLSNTKELEEPINDSNAQKGDQDVLEGTGEAKTPLPPAQHIPSIALPPSSDDVPTASEAIAAANESILKDKSHIVLVGKEADRTPPSERAQSLDQEEKESKATGETPLREVASTDEAEALPGTRTQEQQAADGDEAGSSVAD